MKYTQIPVSDAPLYLLLEADPSKKKIDTYLPGSWCFAAIDAGVVEAICVAKEIDTAIAEIFNISVSPKMRQQGIGSKLLKFTLSEITTKGVHKIELGTGTFGYQLAFYQRHGFRVDSVIKDYFLHNYDQAIIENGVQHKDMLRLSLDLTNRQQ
ncbi:GNAT family N-acetyltransferase [Microbulbifer sp. A4B17]|uniref:GNAT family N-acetyltransferase n=1 Tax=Microbulbifer sp. A4B17 TaxID=359370 RepID=UPI000D52E8C5|nr:GNAT family N-acetyltransferase [Microbulbifer sp. A4B17]AWF80915.1 GNAT family N-acetyltransferase [Microbulbifer sp. A4B17]